MPTGFKPLIDQDARWIGQDGRPTPEFYDYARKLDLIVRNVAFGSLTSAADDTAAATAGVQIGEFYRTASAVKVRVT